MSIQSEINRISGNVSDALDAIEAKGVTIPTGANSDNLATLIGQISGGGGGGSITQDQDGYLVLSPDGGGGGGGGLEYEEGTFTPTSDINNYSISFSNSHANRPYHIIVTDVTGTPQSVSGGLLVWMCSTWYDAFGQAVEAGNETAFYGRIQYAVGGTSYGMSGQNFTLIDGTSTSAISRYVSNTGFQLYTITCKANRTYKWIAVWPPTT